MASSVVDEMAKRKVEEDETQVPPQGGEAKICFTMFISLVLSILSAVTMLYATVIIYKPSMQEIKYEISKVLAAKTAQDNDP
jgi:hypothetical protein